MFQSVGFRRMVPVEISRSETVILRFLSDSSNGFNEFKHGYLVPNRKCHKKK